MRIISNVFTFIRTGTGYFGWDGYEAMVVWTSWFTPTWLHAPAFFIMVKIRKEIGRVTEMTDVENLGSEAGQGGSL